MKAAFIEEKEIEKCFSKFKPSKQYQFAYYIANAKRHETKLRRLDNMILRIINGVK